MAIANTTIQLKKSGATGNVPTSLNLGELALNYADGRLYYKNSVGTITYISSGATSNSFATINANSSLVIATSNTDILSIAPGNNITVTANTTSKTITVGLSNNITIPGTLTTGSGSGGYITGANIIYANTFVANTGGITSNGIVTVNYINATTTSNAAIEMYGANTKGGTGYFDFIAANNKSAGTTNPNKWFRIDSNGKFQIINSLYTAAIFDLNDSGYLTVPGGIATSQYIQFSDGSRQYAANSSLSNTQILSGLKTVSNTSNITFDWVASANNGQGFNFKVGDDTWIGDINVADTMSVRGQQNAANGYIIFGNADSTSKLGRAGSGPLTYAGGFNATYIQFGDGTTQYTANAGGAGSSDTIARNIGSAAYTQANAAFIQANAAFAQANATAGGLVTANTNITTANNAAWAAYAAGNTNATNITAVNNFAAAAFANANAAFATANSAQSNTVIIQGVDTAQNTRMTIIEGVDTAQNTRMTIIDGVNLGQNTFMQAAFNKANTSIQTTGDQSITGNLTISKDLSVTGNLIVLGNTIAINTSSFTVVDSLITLGIGNYTTDVLDIGFAGHYNDGSNAHAGFIRDATTKDWYIFKGYTPELNANNNVDINDASFRKANVNFDYGKGNLIATTATVNGWDVSSVWSTQNTNITAVNTYAGSAYAQANATAGGLVTANINITTANNAAWAAYAAGNTNATNITAVNTYAGSAYAAANLALGIDASQNTLITAANTTATTGNNAAQAAFALANTHTSQITIIQGVDVGQNTRMTIIEGVDVTQNARMTIIEGVDTTQNTNITTANTRAYNSVLKTGDVMTGALNIAVTTAATSLTTGALIVGGGLSVLGNAYSTAVYTNGLYYAANGLPISTGGGGGGSSFGTVSVLGSQTANIVASASNTLLTFSAGSGVTITPYSSNNTVSIGILGGAQGVQLDWGLITDTFSAVTFDFGPSLV